MLSVNVENQEINLTIFAEQVEKVKAAAAVKLEELIQDLGFTTSFQKDYFSDSIICVSTINGYVDVMYMENGMITCRDNTSAAYTTPIIDLEVLDLIYLCKEIENKPWDYLLEDKAV